MVGAELFLTLEYRLERISIRQPTQIVEELGLIINNGFYRFFNEIIVFELSTHAGFLDPSFFLYLEYSFMGAILLILLGVDFVYGSKYAK